MAIVMQRALKTEKGLSFLCEMVGQAGSPARLWNLSSDVRASPAVWARVPFVLASHCPPQGCSLGDSGLIALIDHKFFLI